MTQAAVEEPTIAWSWETLSSITTWSPLIFGVGIIIFIYKRSGSLIFLRDLMWRFFGGTPRFENPLFEQLRKDSREIEYFRFEFNIPARTLDDARKAETWIRRYQFSVRDIATTRNYIDWGGFDTPRFKDSLSSSWHPVVATTLFVLAMAALGASIPSMQSEYVMVHFTEHTDVPSFYLSKEAAKFSVLSGGPELDPQDCRSAQVLEAKSTAAFPTARLEDICSFFIDPGYAERIRTGLVEQRTALGILIFWATIVAVPSLITLARRGLAIGLRRQMTRLVFVRPL